MRLERFDPFIDIRSLSAERRAALKQNLVRRAHAARAQAMRRAIVRVFELSSGVMRAIFGGISQVWIAYQRRRERLEGLAQLRAMSDYELRDIGLSRSGIRTAAFSEEKDATLRR
jgi:uncharacterized protein YjiS (DUF1127 family)